MNRHSPFSRSNKLISLLHHQESARSELRRKVCSTFTPGCLVFVIKSKQLHIQFMELPTSELAFSRTPPQFHWHRFSAVICSSLRMRGRELFLPSAAFMNSLSVARRSAPDSTRTLDSLKKLRLDLPNLQVCMYILREQQKLLGVYEAASKLSYPTVGKLLARELQPKRWKYPLISKLCHLSRQIAIRQQMCNNSAYKFYKTLL